MFVFVPDDRLKLVQDFLSEVKKVKSVDVEYDAEKKIFKILPGEATPLDAFKIENVIRAIGLGFSIPSASRLMNDEYILEVIDIKRIASDRWDAKRIKGRVIGSEGKFKKSIEEYTTVEVVVGERYIALLGVYDQVGIAKEAISLLLRGVDHSAVYKFIDNEEKRLLKYRQERDVGRGLRVADR